MKVIKVNIKELILANRVPVQTDLTESNFLKGNLLESANSFGGMVKKGLVTMRKPFKQYGSPLPQKIDTTYSTPVSDKVYLHSFINTIQNDPRPARVK